MAKKVHLDSVAKPNGTVWFTLVFENPASFFVEERFDSNRPFSNNKIKEIKPGEFSGHVVNGVSLSKLVNFQLNELAAGKLSEVHRFN